MQKIWLVSLPLSKVKSDKSLLPLEFSLINSKQKIIKNYSDMTFNADKVELVGFQNNSQVLTASQLKDHCRFLQAELVCQITVPKEIRFLELPMLYYPKLLKITLNEKQIPYDGVLSNGRIIVGVVPEEGNNTIKAKFTGLGWANLASEVSWGVWGIIFLIYAWRIILSSFKVPRNTARL